jgi:hypothetical protein
VFATLFDGDKWMIYYNTLTGVLHWDFVSLMFLFALALFLKISQSSLPRFITFAVSDNQYVCRGSIHLLELTRNRLLDQMQVS